MSTPIWETNEESLHDIVEFASKTTLYDRGKLNQLMEFLINNYDGVEHKIIEKNKILSIVCSK